MKSKIIIGLLLALGLSACASIPGDKNTAPEKMTSASRDLASKFALYFVSERLATPPRAGFVLEGTLADTGISSTTAKWVITPQDGGVLACIIVTPTDKVKGSQSNLVAMFDLFSNQSINKGRITFGENGITTCKEAERKLEKYDVNQKMTSLDFLIGLNVDKLAPYAMTNKGERSYASFNKNGNFFKSQSKIDASSIAQIKDMTTFIRGALKTQSITGEMTDGFQLTEGRLIDSKTKDTIKIPLWMVVNYDESNASYCVSLNGWTLSSTNEMIRKGICNEERLYRSLIIDSLAITKTISSLMPKDKIGYYSKIDISQNGFLTLLPSKIESAERAITSRKIILHPGLSISAQGSIDARGFWCLEINNSTRTIVFNQSYVIPGAFECPALSPTPSS